jgi:hypothetical protein
MQIIKITSKWGKKTPTLHTGRMSTRKSGTSNTPMNIMHKNNRDIKAVAVFKLLIH